MRTIYTFIVSFFCLIFGIGCNNKSQYRIIVRLDSIIISPKPFLPNEVPSFLDSGKVINIKEVDSVQTFNIILQFLDSATQNKLSHPLDDTVLCAAGIRKKDKKIVVFLDTDRDKTFSDEKEILLSDTAYLLVRNLEYFDGTDILKSDFYMRPMVSTIRVEVEGRQSKQSRAFDDPSVVIMANYRYGTLNIGNEMYKFALFNYLQGDYSKNTSFMIAVPFNTEFPDSRFGTVFYQIGDVFYLGDKSYKFIDVSKNGNSVTIEAMPYSEKKIGIDSGYSALNIAGNDVLTSSLFNLSNSRKYILLDFWGTWCNPCLTTIPKLKLLNNERKRLNVEIVSIACNDDIDKVKKHLKKEAIPWTNLFDDSRDNRISDKYRVRAFPTFILIDPEGKIIKRGSSEIALDEAITFLEKEKTIKKNP